MENSIVLGLIQNMAILVSFSMLYDYLWTRYEKKKNLLINLVAGILLGGIGIVIILTTWHFTPGIFFDTRSVFLSICGLFFGFIPTLFAMIILCLYRFSLGGHGVWMGIFVIISSGSIGILARQLNPKWRNSQPTIFLLGLGIIVHLIMLVGTFMLPYELRLITQKNIILPILIIYPAATALLGKLMLYQYKNRENKFALNTSEERWQFAIEGSGDGLWDRNLTTNNIYFSAQWKRMLGFQDDELESSLDVWKNLLHPEDKDEINTIIEKYLKNEISSYEAEYRLRCKNGTYKWILARGKIMSWDSEGKPIRFIGTHTDISDRKEKELLLAQERYLMDSLMSFTPESIYFKDLNSRFIRVNEASARNFGCENTAEVIGKSDFDFYEKNYATKTFNDEQEVIRTGKYFYDEEVGLSLAGKETWGITHKMPLRNETGVIIGTFGISIDITQHKLSELELKKSQALYYSLIEQLPNPVFRKNLDGRYVFVNSKFCEMKNLAMEDIIGKTPCEIAEKEFLKKGDNEHLFKYANTSELVHNRILETGEIYNNEEEFILQDGTKLSIEVVRMPVVDHIGNIIGSQGIIFDITDRKKAEEALIESQALYYSFIDQLPNPVFRKNIEGQFVMVNSQFCKLKGLTNENIIGKKPLEVIVKSKSNKLNNYKYSNFGEGRHELILQTGKCYEDEEIYQKQDGHFLHLDVLRMPVVDHLGNIIGTQGIMFDITDRIQVTNELQKEKIFTELLLDSLPGIFYLYTYPEGKLVRWNKNHETMLGFSADELRNNVLQKDQTRNVLDLISEKGYHRIEMEMDKKDGGSIPFILTGVKMELMDQSYIMGVGIDITDRLNAEKALKESEKSYRELIDGIAETVWIINLDSILIDVNQTAINVLGYTREELISIGIFGVDFSMKKEEIINKINNQTQTETQVFETTHRTKSGKIIPVEIYSSLATYKGQQVVLSIARDITERLLAEEKIRESENKLSTLFESMTEMVVMFEVVFNKEGVAVDLLLTDCNHSFTNITGIKKEDAIGKLANKVHQSEISIYFEEYVKVAISGEPFSIAVFSEALNKHILISVVSPKVNHIAAIVADISAIRESQEQLAEKNKELENYIYIASHDLRSPLVNIQGFSKRLQKQTDSIKDLLSNLQLETETLVDFNKITNESIPKTLHFILSNVTKMDMLINGLLQLSRTGRINMVIKKIDSKKLFKTILAAYNFQLQELTVKIIINDMPDCYGDVNQLNQLFSNIIGNAIKYRDPERQLELEISGQNRADKVLYSIKDNGIGIAPKHLEKIWDVFYRIDPTSNEAGDGIGLSLVKRISEKHKGRICVESELGTGTVFHVELQGNEFTE